MNRYAKGNFFSFHIGWDLQALESEWQFFTPELAGGLSLESEWQQVSDL